MDAEEELNSICGLAEKVLEVRDEHDLMCKLDNQYTTITVEVGWFKGRVFKLKY